MWYLYLDESGDLGFDFVNKKPSKYFTVTILAVQGKTNNRRIIKGVKHTLKRKLNPKNKRRRIVEELKNSKLKYEIKEYFYRQISGIPFAIFSMSLNKLRVYPELASNKERVYNFVARQVLERIRFENAEIQIELIIDKSKSQAQIKEFNDYIINQLEGRIDPRVPLNIRHEDSRNYKGLQAVDLFCGGIYQKYESQRNDWFNLFRGKIRFDEVYLP